ncbi:two-component regulator propeller domain-containing protein [Rufibacter sp. XAAS-G3-1]|uniref:hybrid sensor histidine kinase/response regulator transcription factor n=1 Tax=Rufibacter sp. XAAS-G3-1 TaxID=2729134 RepID=UPI0015E74D92|nr:two-component regulator propeller domain-containing protein [Rufibacter sp. XAAS-G3-1]
MLTSLSIRKPQIHRLPLLWVIWAIGTFSAGPAYGQQDKFSFRHFSISDGLSQSSVISVAQDQNGLMWFGTRDGLNKYDGHTFTQYKHNKQNTTTISNNDITKVVADSKGDLWIGTFHGLNRYDYRQDKFIRFYHRKGAAAGLSDNHVWAICEARNGDLWIGTSKGLNRYNRQKNTFETFYADPTAANGLSSDFILDILQDRDGSFWLATNMGLNRMTLGKNGKPSFTRFVHQPGRANSLSNNLTQKLAQDAQGNLWVGTKSGGLNKLDKKTGLWQIFKNEPLNPNSLSHDDVRTLQFTPEGKLWVGTYMGLNLFDPITGQAQRLVSEKENPQSLSRNSVKSVFLDKKGSLWVGTYYGGLNLLDSQNSNFKNYKNKTTQGGLNFDVISAIKEDAQGNLYIGTEGGGVNVLNPRTHQFSYLRRNDSPQSLSNNNVKSLLLDNQQHLWVGTFNAGLNIVNLKTGHIKKYRREAGDPLSISNDNIYSIVQQNDSLFWLGTHGGGLNLFNRQTGKAIALFEGTTNNLSSNLVRTLLKDARGNLWVGTQYGLNLLPAQELSADTPQFKRFFYDEELLTGEDVLTIFEDSQKRIWVGTSASGLSLYDPAAGTFKTHHLARMTGSASNLVHGILEDQAQNLWISTNQGLLKYHPGKKTFKVYNEIDGVVSNEFNNNSRLKARNGYMYFGSLAGLTSFHPDSISRNRYAPPVVLTDFKLFGKSVKAGEKESVLDRIISATRDVVLDYDQAIFSIDFALPSFVNSKKNQYAYRLKGLEEEWNYTTSNSATYTIQAAGDYVFEVKGANNDGLWTAAPTTLMVRVNPAPWFSWWAFLVYALLVVAAIYQWMKVLLSRSKLQHALELEHLDKQRQEELNQMKIQFFTNVSHEFRTPLTLILAPLEQLVAKFRDEKDTFKQLVTMENNANRLRRLIDELMDFRKYENNGLRLKASEGNIVKFVEDVYASFQQFAEIQKYQYSFSSDADSILAWYDREKLERVVLNLISNAFKYTPRGGTIVVRVQQLPTSVEIRITDNGVGIEEEHLEKIFDRFYEVDQSQNLLITKYNKGTGIGLALAKGIVNLHSGKIEVKSKKKEGSTFAVELPLGNAHLQPEQMVNSLRSSEEMEHYEIETVVPAEVEELDLVTAVPRRFERSVLVVEDNDNLRKFISQMFQDEYHVLEAAHGQEGLELAQRHVPDIIISDVMMPEMDGIEFCALVKSNLETSHIPFILLTARTSQQYKYEGLETGADDYLNKPFNVQELTFKVRNLVTTQQKLKDRFASQTVVKPKEITVSSLDEKLLEKALVIVEENISNETFDIATFCEELGVSRTMLFTKVKAWTNLTPNEFIHTMRMKRAAQLLEQHKLNISEVGYEVGFRNPKYFSKCFHKHYSETPTAYAKRFAAQKVEKSPEF